MALNPRDWSMDQAARPASRLTAIPAAGLEHAVGEVVGARTAMNPARIAVHDKDGTLLAGGLDAWANAVACAVFEVLAGDPGAPVALLLPHDRHAVVGTLGALRSGRPYVPVDPTLPPERIAALVARSGSRAVVTTNETRATAPAHLPIVTLDELAERSAHPPDVVLAAGDPAHVLFTSGSTGEPKGLVHSHRNILHAVAVTADGMDVRPHERTALLFSYSFLASTSYLFGPLVWGGEVHPYDLRRHGLGGLGDWLDEREINHIAMVPSVLRSLGTCLAPGRRLRSLRVISLGGEPLRPGDIDVFTRIAPPGCQLMNRLGSTEANQIAGCYLAPDLSRTLVDMPVGWPVPDTFVRVVDQHGQDLPSGQIGELMVGSRFLADGYWGDAEATSARFHQEQDGLRWYRTGDLAKISNEGCVIHLGRADESVKVRGQLVSLPEVERELLGGSGVTEAAVVAVPSDRSGTRLVGFVVLDHAGPRGTTVRDALLRRLPPAMVPSLVSIVPALPRTARDKVDRRTLAAAAERLLPQPSTPYRPPHKDIEFDLAELWTELLQLERIGADDDVTTLGADSLAMAEFAAVLADRLNLRLDLADLAERRTVATQADLLADGRGRGRRSLVVQLAQMRPEHPTLICLPGGGSTAQSFAPIARHLNEHLGILAIEASGLHRRGLPDRSVQAAARRTVRLVTEQVPVGPLVLAGHSYGGLIAWETARLLERAGRAPELVLILDTPNPDRYPPAPLRKSLEGGPVHPLGVRLVEAIRRPARAGRRAAAGLFRFGGMTQYNVFWQLAMYASRRYHPRPLAGRVLVLAAGNQQSPDETIGWGRLCSGPVRTGRLAGTTHENMVREPAAGVIAEELLKVLSETRLLAISSRTAKSSSYPGEEE